MTAHVDISEAAMPTTDDGAAAAPAKRKRRRGAGALLTGVSMGLAGAIAFFGSSAIIETQVTTLLVDLQIATADGLPIFSSGIVSPIDVPAQPVPSDFAGAEALSTYSAFTLSLPSDAVDISAAAWLDTITNISNDVQFANLQLVLCDMSVSMPNDEHCVTTRLADVDGSQDGMIELSQFTNDGALLSGQALDLQGWVFLLDTGVEQPQGIASGLTLTFRAQSLPNQGA